MCLSQACLHTLRGGTVIPVLEGVTLADLRTLPMTSYPAITLEEYAPLFINYFYFLFHLFDYYFFVMLIPSQV